MSLGLKNPLESMPSFAKNNLKELEELVKTAGSCKATLSAKENVEKTFLRFVKPEGFDSLEELVKDESKLEKSLMEFFWAFRVNKGKDRPKIATVNIYKSFLKTKILQITKGKIDIGSSAQFQQLSDFFKSYGMELKKAGKADTKNRDEISEVDFKMINDLLVVLNELMVLDEADLEYGDLMSHIPKEYEAKYHELTQHGAICILLTQVCNFELFLLFCCCQYLGFCFHNANLTCSIISNTEQTVLFLVCSTWQRRP